MFMFHVAYALELIALGVGLSFLIWSLREKGNGIILARIFGYIITILAILLFIFSVCSNIAIWRMHQQMMKLMAHPGMNPMIVQPMMVPPQQKPMQVKVLHKQQSSATSTQKLANHQQNAHKPITQKASAEKSPVQKATTAANTPNSNSVTQ